MDREIFYQKQLGKFIKDKDANILVIGAGSLDKKVFKKLDYKNVTFSNLENTIDNDLNFLRKNIGIAFNFAFYNLFIDYSLQEYNSINLGVSLGVR